MNKLTPLLALVLAGCAGLPYDPHGLPVEVVQALTRDNKTVVACTSTQTPWGPVFQAQIAVDTGSAKNGGVEVSERCVIKFTTQQSAPKVTTVVTTESTQ